MENQARKELSPVETQVFELAERAIELKTLINATKKFYEELDVITLKLKELQGVGTEVEVNDFTLKIVDNFESKNTVFRPTGVKRFELDIKAQK